MLNKEKRENYEKNSEYSFIKGNIELDEQKLDQLLHLEENFDLLKRKFDIGGLPPCRMPMQSSQPALL